MWDIVNEVTEKILESKELLKAIAYLLAGAIVGAVISVKYSLVSKKPKLISNGGGSGGNQEKYSWSMNIRNQPSFFGQNVDGESARDVRAYIRLDKKKFKPYLLLWGPEGHQSVTIEPGQQKSLMLFHRIEGTNGYIIVDHSGDPVRSFQGRDLKFIVTLNDRLGRKTVFKFMVDYDDTHLKNLPGLQIVRRFDMRSRLRQARSGLNEFFNAFRAK